MRQLNLNQLPRSLENLSPLYVIHGEEELLIIEAVDTIRASVKKQGYIEREKHVLDQSANWQSVLDAANSSSLFSNQKLLEIHIPSGKPGNEGAAALQDLALRLPEDTITLIILPKIERAQQQSKWFTALAKAAQVVEAKSITKEALPKWITDRLSQINLSIEPVALELFAERVEGNLLAAKQEVDKLGLLFPAGTTLNEKDIKDAIANVARFDAFQLSEAWLGGDAPRLLRLLDSLEQEGDAPVLLLWSLSEDIRILLRLRAHLSQGQNIASVSRDLRLWGAKQTLAPQALKRIGARRLLDALQECAKIDRQIKGAEDGDAWASLKVLVLSLMAS